MKQPSRVVPPDADQKRGIRKPVPPLPTVGAPLDGSQYQNIIEEQAYSGQRPSAQKQADKRSESQKAG